MSEGTTARKTILFATDFSDTADAALAEAAAVAREHGAKLLILHVQGPLVAYAMTGPCYMVPETESDRLKEALSRIVPPGQGLVCEHLLVMGDPASEIVRIARDEQTDMIVMGSHGRRGLNRLLLGSVAETVLRHAPCPVLIYRGDQRQPASEPRPNGTGELPVDCRMPDEPLR